MATALDTGVLDDTDDLAVRFVPGRGQRLVLSFRGLGHKDRTGRPEEFWGSISQGGQNNMLFIADKAQSWYNTRGMMRRISDHIAAVMDRVQPRQTFAIGNSMGAYGACLFSKEHDFDAVVAICPQVSLDQSVMPDQRWVRYARRVRVFRAPPLAECLRDQTRYFILSGGRGLEGHQADGVPIRPNVRHYIFRRMFHAVAENMKAQGQLTPFIDTVLNGENIRAERMLRDAGAHLRTTPLRPAEEPPLGAEATDVPGETT